MNSQLKMIATAIIVFFVILTKVVAAEPLICNQFDIKAELISKKPLTVKFKIVSNLPDDTHLSVILYRPIDIDIDSPNKDDEYSLQYGNGKTYILKNVKSDTTIMISPKFSAKHQVILLKKFGAKIKEISDKMILNVVVPVIQDNPAFGKYNKNLTGSKVTQGYLGKHIDESITLHCPIEDDLKVFIDKKKIKLSKSALEVKILYTELMSFKDTVDFHYYGFRVDYKYNSWLKRCEAIIREANITNPRLKEELDSLGISPNLLMVLGIEYMQNNSLDNDLTRQITEIFENGFNM